MRNQLYRPYSSTEAVSFALPDMTGADFNTATALASGDVQISKDGAAFANVTNLPSNSSGQVVWTPAAGELTAKSIRLRVRDQTSPAEFPAMLFVIETYGHASAMHPNLGADVSTNLAAVKAKTDNLPSDPADASDITSAFGTVNATLATIDGRLDTEIPAILAAVDTEVAAIKAIIDGLVTDGATTQLIAQEVWKVINGGRGNKKSISGSNLVATATDGVTAVATVPFTRLGSSANPIASVG